MSLLTIVEFLIYYVLPVMTVLCAISIVPIIKEEREHIKKQKKKAQMWALVDKTMEEVRKWH